MNTISNKKMFKIKSVLILFSISVRAHTHGYVMGVVDVGSLLFLRCLYPPGGLERELPHGCPVSGFRLAVEV